LVFSKASQLILLEKFSQLDFPDTLHITSLGELDNPRA